MSVIKSLTLTASHLFHVVCLKNEYDCRLLFIPTLAKTTLWVNLISKLLKPLFPRLFRKNKKYIENNFGLPTIIEYHNDGPFSGRKRTQVIFQRSRILYSSYKRDLQYMVYS